MAQSVTFQNREEASRKLAEKLLVYSDDHPLVLGVPRGGVPMARIIAEKLCGDLDILLVHKVGHPDHPEYAVASVSEEGELTLSEGAGRSGLTEVELRPHAEREIAEMKERRRLFTPHRGPIDVAGRVCVVIDDGIATGATMTSAVRSLRAKGASRIIVATPVASEQAVTRLEKEGAEVVTVFVPRVFFSVGQFYEDFDQVSTEEAVEALRQGERRQTDPTRPSESSSRSP